MDNQVYYFDLAERIFFFGLKPEELAKIATLKPGKTFRDLVVAVKQGNLAGLGYFGRQAAHVADRMTEVIEINPSDYDKTYSTDGQTIEAGRF